MINQRNLPMAYKEVLEVLKHISRSECEKVPKDLIEQMEIEQDKNYDYKVTHISDFENQEMMLETKYILAILFRDYWATDEQRKKIKAKEVQDLMIEENQNGKYNREELFKNTVKTEVVDKNENEQTQLIEYKEKIIKKILNKIKRLFKNNK
jgi:hypothetical protein